jgi:hypothetical protein
MGGFESPKYTQSPNDLFKMLPDMGDAELRVTLVMVRQTFGFHREKFKMGISKLATAAGLSPQGARDGAAAAEKRGTFRRVNPDESTEAEWELVVNTESDPSTELSAPLQPVEGNPPASRGQLGVKERLKKDSKESKKILQKSDPAWAIVHGESISEEEQEKRILQENAFDAFETDMNTPDKWSWYPARSSEDPAWKLLREFVVEQYAKDKKCFQTYQTWRTQPYARGAMSNLAIKKNPENFPASWTDFLASNAMYGKPSQPTRLVDTDENDSPISY